MSITLYNTLTRRKEAFQPIDAKRVRMYVCGPTVYDFAHIGNARPVIVFDVLFRLLRHVYGVDHVTYARNITDVDDKINARALQEHPKLDPIAAILRSRPARPRNIHKDIAALGVLPPTVEPKATEHMAEMRVICDALIAKGHAYVATTTSCSMSARCRTTAASPTARSRRWRPAPASMSRPYKKGPMDFVLWKPSDAGMPAWPSPGGIKVGGRPGWHLECSAMALRHLGEVFDIHGGGVDLVFPHHENEIAQSRCAHGTAVMANVWMHNGFLQVEGEKMSKSLGNFFTINQLLATPAFGGKPWHGRVLRYAMLSTHYRQPIDWTVERLTQARATLADLADMSG